MVLARKLHSARSLAAHTPWRSSVAASSRRLSRHSPATELDNTDQSNDFILSVLRAGPSLRDTKGYLASFSPRPPPRPAPLPALPVEAWSMSSTPRTAPVTTTEPLPAASTSPVVASILDPVYKHTALVKIQGPFSDRQLESIARGMVYLEKLGLVSIIVVERDDWQPGRHGERHQAVEDAMRVAAALEQQGAKARPMLDTLVRLGPHPDDVEARSTGCMEDPAGPPEAHALLNDLVPLRSALRAGEIPVLPPLVLDSFCRSVRVDANDMLAALARGLVEAATRTGNRPADAAPSTEINLTPLRLMIINREGGIPSYARAGLPHLLVNLSSEYDYIHDTFDPSWNSSHPKSLSNLALARQCLSYMPPSASAVMVSHRSPKALIGNLITNKPALSSSLPHALLQTTGKLTPDTPTVIRRGLPVRVIRSLADVDRPKLAALLETSFRRTLDQDAFFLRLEQTLDYVIVAGDYAGAAVVTNEGGGGGIAYLDKFAVAPAHQGDGTVDFLWVALHDESYGLGLPYSVNPNGGKEGAGVPRDLVWRSRADNPVNKWYFERASGHMRLGHWVLFWCDAEATVRERVERRFEAGGGRRTGFVEDGENGRVFNWARAIDAIPSSWSA
ncbi:mitochondrial amino-acid acetyltransferase [Auricularia subglabra TFB-10046 SS5]|nr:mitochondrial amino-acid acetyltransferase [Auricularia subglabra TFB-10046 SS5]